MLEPSIKTQTLVGDCTLILPTLPIGSVRTIVTSPPYYLKRNYKVPETDWPEISFVPMLGLPEVTIPEWRGCLGFEPSPIMFVAHLVHIFRLMRPVLADDGNAWLNLGDKYAQDTKFGGGHTNKGKSEYLEEGDFPQRTAKYVTGVPDKNLIGIPWRVALALQADGWFLRSEIIWQKTAPMVENVEDRPTYSHEQLFLLAKSERYYYNSEAIKEPARNWGKRTRTNGKYSRPDATSIMPGPPQTLENGDYAEKGRNKRDVWTINPQPFRGDHPAVMPEALAEPCILAGSEPGDVVLDPFAGTGTTQRVATRLGRNSIGIEISKRFVEHIEKRTDKVQMQLLTAV